jgi:hypothetical protein
MKLIIKFTITILSALSINANSQNSVVPSGKTEISAYGSLSFTIGDIFYTQKGETYNFSEGNQQPFKINPIENGSNLHISIYPNPSSDYIYFLVEDLNFKNLSFQLSSINGKVLQFGKITNQKSLVPLNNLTKGVYLLKIRRGALEENTYKIIKY